MTIPVAVYGATGYGGQELLRLLAGHPQFGVAAALSRSQAGVPVESVHANLAGFYPGLEFTSPEAALPHVIDVAVLAVPHGTAASIAERLGDRRIVDLSRDFRADHEWAYGVPETNRKAIAAARHVANPGCFATGAVLALAPLAEHGMLRDDVTLTQTTGSSGSGANAKAGTHHPERAQDMRAYKVLTHQHEPEVVRELKRMGATAMFDLAMIPQSGPFARGIFTAAHLRVPEEIDVEALYRERYASEPFVRMREGTPALRHVARTNFCDIAVHRRGERVVVLSAIDNLGKGMATQAVQNLNLICGLDETTGLLVPGANL
ncbi:MAG: N-acetyl-gamma-glutamyl-phosphate reductase [Planctomycetota bacterium]|jgi:N-acetyl-gamma-glutamyl-phosphate reductase